MGDKHVEHNGSGYVDTTVDYVVRKEYNRKACAKEDCKYRHMMNDIKDILMIIIKMKMCLNNI